jgi:hypothetical protein
MGSLKATDLSHLASQTIFYLEDKNACVTYEIGTSKTIAISTDYIIAFICEFDLK